MRSILRLAFTALILSFTHFSFGEMGPTVSCENLGSADLKGVTPKGALKASQELTYNEDSLQRLSDQYCINQAIMKDHPDTRKQLQPQNNKIEAFVMITRHLRKCKLKDDDRYMIEKIIKGASEGIEPCADIQSRTQRLDILSTDALGIEKELLKYKNSKDFEKVTMRQAFRDVYLSRLALEESFKGLKHITYEEDGTSTENKLQCPGPRYSRPLSEQGEQIKNKAIKDFENFKSSNPIKAKQMFPRFKSLAEVTKYFNSSGAQLNQSLKQLEDRRYSSTQTDVILKDETLARAQKDLEREHNTQFWKFASQNVGRLVLTDALHDKFAFNTQIKKEFYQQTSRASSPESRQAIQSYLKVLAKHRDQEEKGRQSLEKQGQALEARRSLAEIGKIDKQMQAAAAQQKEFVGQVKLPRHSKISSHDVVAAFNEACKAINDELKAVNFDYLTWDSKTPDDRNLAYAHLAQSHPFSMGAVLLQDPKNVGRVCEALKSVNRKDQKIKKYIRWGEGAFTTVAVVTAVGSFIEPKAKVVQHGTKAVGKRILSMASRSFTGAKALKTSLYFDALAIGTIGADLYANTNERNLRSELVLIRQEIHPRFEEEHDRLTKQIDDTISRLKLRGVTEVARAPQVLALMKKARKLASLSKQGVSGAADKLTLNKEELASLPKKFHKISPKDPQYAEFKSYMDFSRNLKPADKSYALKHADAALDAGDGKRGIAQVLSKKRRQQARTTGAFQRNRTKAQKFEDQEKLRLLEEAQKKGKPMSDAKARRLAKENTKRYRKILNECSTKADTPAREWANKTFFRFSVPLEVGTGMATYSVVHAKEFKDERFVGKFSAQAINSLLMATLFSKVIVAAKGSMGNSFAGIFSLNSALDIPMVSMYAAMNGITEDDARDQLATMVNDPNFPSFRDKIIKTMQNKKLTSEYLKSVFTAQSPKQAHAAGAPFPKELEEFSKMTSKQLEDPKVQEKYVGLIQSYMYRQNSGGVVATGRPDLDRWLFNRYAGVRGPLLSIPTNIYIWNIICKSQLSPGKTLAMVASINVGQKLFFKYLHFLEQDKTIGQ